MNIQDMEDSIQDTTGNTSEPDQEMSEFFCPCGTNFSDCDIGVSVTLKRCALCYTTIRNELGAVESASAITSGITAKNSDATTGGSVGGGLVACALVADTAVIGAPVDDTAVDDALLAGAAVDGALITGAVIDDALLACAAVAGAALDGAEGDESIVAETTGDDAAADGTAIDGASVDCATFRCSTEGSALSMEEIEVAMSAAVSNAIRCFNITLNGRSELFTFFFDPVESGTRKLYKRTSWTIEPLYWYDIFGGMMTTRGKTLITPCAFRDKKGNIHILMAIAQTLCNRPRYDGLVVAFEDDKPSFIKNIGSFVSEILLEFPFDSDLMDR